MIEWVHKNLFRTWFDGFISIFLTTTIIWLASKLINWGVIHAVWTAESLEDCQSIMAGASGACWAIFNGHIKLFLFGFYPEEYYWRPIFAFILLLLALLPVVVPVLRPKLIWFTVIYPFIAFVLIWGAFGLEPVNPYRFGGFMLVLILGVPSVGLAVVAGVLLALGRLYGIRMMRLFCRALIALFNGVPIIAWLFFASAIVNYLLPPGLSISILVRLMFVFGLVAAARIAGIIEAELRAIPPGQDDAARALGLSAAKAFWLGAVDVHLV